MSTKKVYAAINAVQKVLAAEGITKSRTNTGQNYKFRGIDDVYNSVSGLLSVNGLSILPRYTERVQVERTTQKGAALFYTTVKGEFDFVSTEDGSIHTVVTFGEAMDSADKSTNKAMSAAYKYALLQAFSIPTVGDNDADGSTPDPIKPAGDEKPPVQRQAAPVQKKEQPASNPQYEQMHALLDNYGAKRKTFANKTAEALGYKAVEEIPDEKLPEAIALIMEHQEAVAKAKAAKGAAKPAGKKPKADLPPPDDGNPSPDQLSDDGQDDDGIPV